MPVLMVNVGILRKSVLQNLFLVNRTVANVIAKNAGEAALPYHEDLTCSQINFLIPTSVLFGLSEESPI